MRSALRHLLALPLALVLTFALVWLMKGLVTSQSIADELEQPPARLVFVANDRVEFSNPEPPAPEPEPEPEPEPIPEPEPEPEPLPQPEPPPEKAPIPLTQPPVQKPIQQPTKPKPTRPLRPTPKPKQKAKPKAQKKRPAKARAQARFDNRPIYRPKPSYPRDARRKGQEGWVLVGFNVTRSGAVSNVRVISAQPRGVFERQALAAVKRWRYQKQPVVRQGIRSRIRFRLR